MKVLFVVRPDASSRIGGDVVHARAIAAQLRGDGVIVDVAETAQPQPRGYDLAHIFGVFEPEVCARQIAACRAAGVAVALSPIWWDHTEYFARAPQVERALLRGRSERRIERRLAALRATDARRILGWKRRRWLARRHVQQARLLTAAAVLLPNSEMEAWLYRERLGIRDIPSVVVPNAVDSSALKMWRRPRRGVLCAARIESRKNQAMLAFALRHDPVELTFVGERYDRDYGAATKRWAGPASRFLEPMPQAQLFKLLAEAAVHALPSWLETPGLASLEAAAAGARIVVGDRGCEREYFAETAEYADPVDPASIRAAVLRALEKPQREQGDALDVRLQQLTWQRAARRTVEAYRIALNL